MMNALEKLKKFLGDSPHDYELNLLVFPQYDLGKIREELRLEELGRERGEELQPPRDAIDMDSVETSIVTRFETEKHHWHDNFQNHLSTFQQRLTALNLECYFTDVRTFARDAIGEFKAEIFQRQHDLTLEREHVIDSKKHFKNFKFKNCLIRPANYPDSRILHYGIIALLCLLETIMNGFFLALGDEFGLIGGITQAFLIAILNVGFAFLIGRYALPEVNHISFLRKVIGFLLVLAYLFIAIAFNIGVAHYRDALLNDVENASRQAINSFLAGPFDVREFQSIVMIGIGSLFSFISCTDGYNIGDRYPGYERESRQHKRIYDDYISKVDDAIYALKEIRDQATESLQSLREDLNKRRRSYEAILTSRTRFINQFNAYLDYIETVGNDLLSIYRTANQRSRTPNSIPSHFSQRWAMPRPTQNIPNPPSFTLEALDAALKKTDEALEQSINDLYDAFEKSIPKFKRIDDLD